MAFPASPADGQTTIINGVTYIYSLANVSWSPYASNSTVAYTSIAVSGNANVTGTTTSGTEIVTGNETVGGNSYVTGTLTAGSVVSASLIKRVGNAGAIDLNSTTYFIGSQVVGFDVATNKPGQSYGTMLNIQERNDTAAQLVIDYDTGNLYTRGIYVPTGVSSGNTPTITSWKTVLHSGNYTSYSPSLTGSGASGTWGISISGNSATATKTTYINAPDGDRNASTKLPTTTPFGVRFDFVTSGTTGTGGNYAGVMTYAPWDGTTGSTGDASYQLVFGSTAANSGGYPQLNIRKGIDSVWNSWYSILTSGNYNSYAPTLTGGNASGTWGINVTGSANTATTATYVTSGQANNVDNWMNFRVMRNANSATSNDGMFIGYGNSNSGLTRIYGGGSTTYCAAMGSADFSPNATNTLDLGTSSLRWRNIYTNDLHLSNGIGDYTLIEGEEDLFLVNNKSGKTFKFALIEVDPSVVPPKAS